jgi:hypothetical protein
LDDLIVAKCYAASTEKKIMADWKGTHRMEQLGEDMRTVQSKDGTKIAFDRTGAGPAVILVHGAIEYRIFDQGMARLAELLAQHFTVFHYEVSPEALTPELVDFFAARRMV